MRGKRTAVSIRRRVEGDRNPAGEPAESWAATTGGHNVGVHIQPLMSPTRSAMMAAQASPGQVLASSHLVILRRGTDVAIDDRLFDAGSGKQYVVKSVDVYNGHIEATVGITS